MTTMINPDGFTFTSSSVYIAYEDVRATDLCTQIGTTIPNITFAFARSSVTEDLGALDVPFDTSGMADCTATTVPPRGIGSPAFNPHAGCFPMLRFQAAMLAPFQSIWSNCDNVTGVVLDPPIFLTAASALVSVTTPGSDSSPVQTLAATTGREIQPIPRITGVTTTSYSSVPGTPDPATASATNRNDQWQSPTIQIDSKNHNLPSTSVHGVTTADPSAEATASVTFGNNQWQQTTTQLDSKNYNILPTSSDSDLAKVSSVNGLGDAYKPGSAVASGDTMTVPRSKPNSILEGQATSLKGDSTIAWSGTVDHSNSGARNPSIALTPISSLSISTTSAPTRVVAAGQTIDIPESGATILTIIGHTLNPEHAAITISGTVLSLASNALIVGTSTILLASGTPSAPQPTKVVSQPWEPTIMTHTETSVGSNGVVGSLTHIAAGNPLSMAQGIPFAPDGSASDNRADSGAVANTEAASVAGDLAALINSGFGGASGKDSATTRPGTTFINGNSSSKPFLGVAGRPAGTKDFMIIVGGVWMSSCCISFFIHL